MRKYKFSDRTSAKLVKQVLPLVEKIEAKWKTYQTLKDNELKALTNSFKVRLKDGESLDSLLIDSFAAICEASTRVLHMAPYSEQIIGGIFLHQGKIAELRTGEGKTLVAVLPAYLNALTGDGVHIVTVNDYLAKRDSDQMGEVFGFMGLTTGLVLSGSKPEDRKEAYACDITYVTNSEIGFDYLRDNMSLRKEEMVQRGLAYAIVDEVDSILIDEARTPLIISRAGSITSDFYSKADEFAKSLKLGSGLKSHNSSKLDYLEEDALIEDGDFNIDEKDNIAVLTDEGIEKAEKFFHLENFADKENVVLQHAVQMALKAQVLMKKDKDYIVRDGGVLIVDEFTGRVMDGRRFSDGLHQALEAKEGVEINPEDDTLATVTYQSFFNKYRKKCGMTGTAMTEQREFRDIYKMQCVCIPTHKPIQRIDEHDVVYATRKEKFSAVADHVRKLYDVGQPVLIGTSTVSDSEYLSDLLKDIPHEVLNAKQDAHEAEIIAKAGQYKAVTIATDMAGRGTDIKLDEIAKEKGGLYVIGTQRHESRRVDNQLRGRSGRQGDPGKSIFYLSLEDDLLRLFGSDKMAPILSSLHLQDGVQIKHRTLSHAIEKAQKHVEANNFSIRKNLVDYDSVIDVQRTLIYDLRAHLMQADLLKHAVMDIILGIVRWYALIYKSDREKFIKSMESLFPMGEAEKDKIRSCTEDEFIRKTSHVFYDVYDRFEMAIGSEYLRDMERVIILKNMDKFWVLHLNNTDKLRQAVSMQAYAQKDPVVQFKIESYQMFDEMLEKIRESAILSLFMVEPPDKVVVGVDSRKEHMKFEISD